MRFSLMTEPQLGGSYDDLLAAAHWAEANDLASFARSDHYYSSREPRPAATDAFTTLAGLARDTTTIRLCILVAPLTFRHPAVIAKSAATLDEMSGGRLDLGVGTGWMELEHDAFGLPFPDWSERFERLTETLEYLKAAFGGSGARLDGRYYTLDADVYPTPTRTRLIVGGSGKRKTPTLAGTHADEYNHFVTTPEKLAPKVAVMRRAAEDAGRDPGSITVSLMGPVFVGRDEAEYRAVINAAASERDIDVAELEGRLESNGIPTGWGDRLSETLTGLAEVGVEHLYFQHLDLGDLSTLDATLAALKTATSDL